MSTFEITDEMVEAARKAWHETYLAAAPRAKLSPGIPPTLTVYTGGEALRFRAVITAVAPLIRAAALDEAAKVAGVEAEKWLGTSAPHAVGAITNAIRALAKERGDE